MADKRVCAALQRNVDFKALYEINSDIAAWLTIEGTPVNYPVVQHKNNTYYLFYLFNKTRGDSGCLFFDCFNKPDFSDYNTIIYGHNMRDSTMFSTLPKYKNQSYYEAHPQISLLTPDGNYTVALFAGYVSENDGVAWTIDFEDEKEFAKWVENSRSKSAFKSDVTYSEGKRVVTLSTCDFDFEYAYFVVAGFLNPAEP